MDDFKPQQQTPPQRPDEPQGFNQPNPDNEPETYVTPEGQPTTLGEAHAEPQAQTVVSPKKSGTSKWVLGGMALLLIAAACAFAFWQWAEAQNTKNELSSTKTQLDAAQKANNESDKTDALPANDPETDTSEKAQRSRVLASSSDYYCVLKDFGCDKVVSTVTKFQEAKVLTDSLQHGFAIVEAKPAIAEKETITLHLASIDGLGWTVIYEGKTLPKDIADKFAVPANF